MKFALIHGERHDAQPSLTGECPGCLQPVVARCGEVRVWHWAHRARQGCAAGGEKETEWHRAWKNRFPEEWQEIVHTAQDGQRHIADVKTRDGWVLEFQHSYLKPDERRSRESFYPRLMWVVNGARRERDEKSFAKCWDEGDSWQRGSLMKKIFYPQGALLRDWSGSRAHVFFEFGASEALWWLYPGSDETRAYVHCISRTHFIEMHRREASAGPAAFDSMLQRFTAFVRDYEMRQQVAAVQQRQALIPVRYPRGVGWRSPRL